MNENNNNSNLGYNNIDDNNSSNSRFTKSRINSVYFDPMLLNIDNVSSIIIVNLKTNIRYSLLFKVKYNGSYFAMLGHQEGFILPSLDDNKSIERLLKNLKNSILVFCAEYPVEHIDLIQMLYVPITDIPKLRLTNINKIKLNKEFLNIKDEKFNFSSRVLPLSLNSNHYGKLLVGKDRLSYLDVLNKEKRLLLHKEKLVDDIDSMYLYRNEFIILNKKVGDLVFSREVYIAETGKYVNAYLDTVLDSNNNTFSRKKGKLVLYVSNDKIIHLVASKDLSIIKYVAKGYKAQPNPFIGSLDLETYLDTDGYTKIYALGYIVSGEKPKTFYIDKDMDSDKLLLKCLDSILIGKYDKCIFYTHNFGGYDSVFILKVLKEVNIKKGFEYYKLDPLYRGSNALKLNISVKKELSDRKQRNVGVRKEPGFYKITIADSYALLNDNLFDLSHSFDIKAVKGHFPHSFVKKDTLNYIGNTPPMHY